MPNYQYKCECKRVKELTRKVEERNEPVKCKCGKLMKLTIGKPEVIYQEGFLKW